MSREKRREGQIIQHDCRPSKVATGQAVQLDGKKGANSREREFKQS
jgi:hypothetical protein